MGVWCMSRHKIEVNELQKHNNLIGGGSNPFVFLFNQPTKPLVTCAVGAILYRLLLLLLSDGFT